VRLLDESPAVRFEAPRATYAGGPAERRGIARDGVRLLVADASAGVVDTRFDRIGDHLSAGDLLVVNDSATVAGALDGVSDRHGAVVVHLATPLDDGTWVVEVRRAPDADRSILDGQAGDRIDVAAGRSVLRLQAPYPTASSPTGVGNRLWRATWSGSPLQRTARRYGRPIAYGYLDERYPLSDHQTVFGRVPGSAEMASAARPFTAELVTRLVARGVLVAPVTLHTGVSSQEAGEAPQAERFVVPAATADLVNLVRARGRRVVAVGTSATRALESAVVTGSRGIVAAATGWTTRVVTPGHPPQVVQGLVTGWHDPGASHLLLVEAVAGEALAQQAYGAATRGGYLWHEFGDSSLLLPALSGSPASGVPRGVS
jgi:S-adenosylmethionine:tRNA ribosyltransferase-isomerase